MVALNDIDAAEKALRSGNPALAVALCRALLQMRPDDARALAVLVNASNLRGDLDAVIDGLQRLLRLHPGHAIFTRMLATARNNRGSGLRSMGHGHRAIDDFRAALTLQPAHELAWFNLAVSLRDVGQTAAAIDAFRRHLAVVPGDAQAQLLLAEASGPDTMTALVDALQPEEIARFDQGLLARVAAYGGRGAAALEALQRWTSAHDADAAMDAVARLFHDGEADAAIQGAERLLALQVATPPFRAQMIRALALPAIYTGVDDLLRWRGRFTEGLAFLESAWSSGTMRPQSMPLRELAHANFLLAYQGHDDLQLQKRFAGLVRDGAHALYPELAARPAGRVRNRIGLLSSFWYESTVGSYFGSWIGWLREAGFEVFLYQYGAARDATTARLAASSSVFRPLDGALEEVARTVRNDDLDLLIYPELGMDARMLPLAALRLARRQAVAWGHPVTSGFDTIDDYITCSAMEPKNATAHYSERLVKLPDLGVDFRRPDIPLPLPPAVLGLDAARPRVLVPQSLFKLHPDGDAVLAAIAQRVPRVQFVCFAPRHAAWRQRFQARVGEAFGAAGLDAASHFAWQPAGSRTRYLQVTQACDLMLDSLHWSGGNTAIDSLLCGLPLVACPGTLMRGRQSRAMLERIGLAQRLVTTTPAEQAHRVVELLDDPSEREDLSRRIHSRLPELFRGTEARSALVDWARVASREAAGAMA